MKMSDVFLKFLTAPHFHTQAYDVIFDIKKEIDFDEVLRDITKRHHFRGMNNLVYIAACIILLVLICGCCCFKRRRGRVLSPPVDVPPPAPPGPGAPAPYPTQQYTVHTPAPYPVPVVTPYPLTQAAPAGYPAMPGPYHANTAPYPSYPSGAMPPAQYQGYPPAPYPSASYPSAPSAPDANVFFGLAAPGWNPQGR
ncbi:unnamed protein product, partial [Brenthis ino]